MYTIKKNDKIDTFIDSGFKSLNHTLSSKELEPFDEIRQSLIGINKKDLIAVYYVSVSYYRESDMEPFSLDEYFFSENQKITKGNEFKKDSRYNKIIEKVNSFDPTKGNELRFTFVGDHKWFVEPDPKFIVRKNPNGSITAITPEDQGETPQTGYPFLDIEPQPFKATGFYTKAQIVDNQIEVKIPFKAKNIGDVSAIITEDGFEPTITIEPKQEKYYTKTLMCGRDKDSQEPLENFINLLDSKEKVFNLKFNILHRPANNSDKLYKVTVHYEIGKKKMSPISE